MISQGRQVETCHTTTPQLVNPHQNRKESTDTHTEDTKREQKHSVNRVQLSNCFRLLARLHYVLEVDVKKKKTADVSREHTLHPSPKKHKNHAEKT